MLNIVITLKMNKMKWDIVDLNQFNIVKEQRVYDFSIIIIVVRRTLVTRKLAFE
jgi:hypothetical protein